jgi:hypothetical protein
MSQQWVSANEPQSAGSVENEPSKRKVSAWHEVEVIHHSSRSLLDKIKHIPGTNLFEKESVILEAEMH